MYIYNINTITLKIGVMIQFPPISNNSSMTRTIGLTGTGNSKVSQSNCCQMKLLWTAGAATVDGELMRTFPGEY